MLGSLPECKKRWSFRRAVIDRVVAADRRGPTASNLERHTKRVTPDAFRLVRGEETEFSIPLTAIPPDQKKPAYQII